MSAEDDLDQVVEEYQVALGEFIKGNPELRRRYGPIEKM